MTADNQKEIAVSYRSLESLLTAEEGHSDSIYPDSKGIPTGGRGHAFYIGSKLPTEIWDLIFEHDINEAWGGFYTLGLTNLSRRRKWVCVAMIFQLGLKGFKGFRKTIEFLKQENYEYAAKEMLNSKWARVDSPARALRMSEIMLKG